MDDKNKYISKDAIRKLMEDGVSAEQIAKQFTDQLNAAIAEQSAKSEKIKEAQTVVDFLTKYYGEMFDGVTVEIILKALDELQDGLDPIIKATSKLGKKIADAGTTSMDLDTLLSIFGK